jgi:hypothetical protein
MLSDQLHAWSAVYCMKSPYVGFGSGEGRLKVLIEPTCVCKLTDPKCLMGQLLPGTSTKLEVPEDPLGSWGA